MRVQSIRWKPDAPEAEIRSCAHRLWSRWDVNSIGIDMAGRDWHVLYTPGQREPVEGIRLRAIRWKRTASWRQRKRALAEIRAAGERRECMGFCRDGSLSHYDDHRAPVLVFA